MNGFRAMTIPVHPESSGGQLQPNPVVAELQPAVPSPPAKKPVTKKKPRQASLAQ
jgi:hypothetical protein